ncbi:hypothetical protein Tco_1367506 [Tanacetum coccineum]
MPPKRTTTPMTNAAIKQLIAQGVADALADYEANRGSENGDDSHNSRNGRRRHVLTTRECTYSDFLRCQPINFKGTEGVIGFTHCSVGNQIKFVNCTLLGSALTWWNSHVKTVGHDDAYEMTWKTLMKMLIDKVFPEESDQVEKYVGGLPDMIQGSVMASKPKTMQEAIEIANDLMDKKVCAYAERQAENKRKLDNKNQAQQQPPKKQNVARAYSAGSYEKKEYAETLPSDCLELKNRNHENQAGGNEAREMVYALGGGETDQDLDNIEDDTNA